MSTKIDEAQEILSKLGLPKSQQNKISGLTFLALCGIKENSSWSSAKRKSLTLAKGIMDFIKKNHDIEYKTGTRESFRKNVLQPFIEYKIADFNPDNPNLPPHSPKSHYAVSEMALEAIKTYGTSDWKVALEIFKQKQINEKRIGSAILRKLIIKNYKSIVDETIELGRVNVFIGSNGCGKSNILEVLAMVAASKAKDLDNDGLYNRGVRIAKPSLTFSSFLNNSQLDSIDVELLFEDENNTNTVVKSSFISTNPDDIFSKWIDRENIGSGSIDMENIIDQIPKAIRESQEFANMTLGEFLKQIETKIEEDKINNNNKYTEIISEFLIYNINTKALRGIQPDSRKQPLGINGEGLDILISTFRKTELDKLGKYSGLISWLSSILIDKGDTFKLHGHKLGKSASTLYFMDKFMQMKNNILSAENTNEGILHVLFYLSLFISDKTPKIFSIDNIETALNPRLCRKIIKEISNLSKEYGKQVLVTTHNPAVLDGLDLFDDEQRLFIVSRTDNGFTRVKRLKLKPETSKQNFMLSELWMRGMIGGIPQDF
jgi:AAA15 family ATPase/GTPase